MPELETPTDTRTAKQLRDALKAAETDAEIKGENLRLINETLSHVSGSTPTQRVQRLLADFREVTAAIAKGSGAITPIPTDSIVPATHEGRTAFEWFEAYALSQQELTKLRDTIANPQESEGNMLARAMREQRERKSA